MTSPGRAPRIIVAFDNGVRALEGETGRELWRTELAGRTVMGVAATTAGAPRIFLIDEKLDHLTLLNGNTGKIEAQYKLKDQAITSPAYLTGADLEHLLIPLKGGVVELRDSRGDYVRSLK